MTKTKNPEVSETIIVPSKPQQILDLLTRDCGATLSELAILANWLPHINVARGIRRCLWQTV